MIYQIVAGIKVKNNTCIGSPKDVFNLLQKYKNASQEYFLLITLDADFKPIGIYIMTIGAIDFTYMHPREVFYRAILDLSSYIIVAHNHPSGNVTPSKKDILITARLKKAADIMGIRIIDHVIISSKKYYSFKKENMVLKRRDKYFNIE
jgi:DNA repair protein RadC